MTEPEHKHSVNTLVGDYCNNHGEGKMCLFVGLVEDDTDSTITFNLTEGLFSSNLKNFLENPDSEYDRLPEMIMFNYPEEIKVRWALIAWLELPYDELREWLKWNRPETEQEVITFFNFFGMAYMTDSDKLCWALSLQEINKGGLNEYNWTAGLQLSPYKWHNDEVGFPYLDIMMDDSLHNSIKYLKEPANTASIKESPPVLLHYMENMSRPATDQGVVFDGVTTFFEKMRWYVKKADEKSLRKGEIDGIKIHINFINGSYRVERY